MPSLIRCLLVYCMISQPSFAVQNAPRPLFNKKETLSFVQKHPRSSITKKELIGLLEKRYGSTKQDQKIIQQVKAENFQILSWSLAYENNQIVMNITKPQSLKLKISELDRLFSAAKVNGQFINLKSTLTDLTQTLESAVKPPVSAFNILIEPAEALVWFVPVLGAVALLALFGGAAAMSGDEQKIETAFTKILENCQKDINNKLTSLSKESLDSLNGIKEYGYDPSTIVWYNTQSECLERNGERYSKKFCQTSADINSCLNKINPPQSNPSEMPINGSAVRTN